MDDSALSRAIDNILCFMTIPPWRHRDHLFPNYPLTPQFFNAAEPFITDKDGEAIFHRGVNRDDYFMFGDATPDDLDDRVDITILNNHADGWTDWREGYFSAQRLRGLTAEQVRGKTSRSMRHYIEWSRVWFEGESFAEAHRSLLGSMGDCRWKMVQSGMRQTPGSEGVFDNSVQAVLGLQFTRRYYWSVELGYQGLPAIHLPTDPVGVREVFRLRDIPEGKSRRDALRHWVTGHWRTKYSDPSAEIFVQDYLRGKTEFTWNGLRCTLRPSRFDQDRYNKLHPKAKAKR